MRTFRGCHYGRRALFNSCCSGAAADNSATTFNAGTEELSSRCVPTTPPASE